MSKRNYNVQDKFFQRAKAEGYRARSVFKLEEIQNKYHIIKSGNRVLDLGAAPGSFLQLIVKVVGSDGLAVGVDLKAIDKFKAENIKTYVGDIFEDSVYQQIEKELGVSQFDVITSDLAPATTGIKSVDAGRSFELNQQVLEVAQTYLKKGGHVLLKCFPGADQDQLNQLLKEQYKSHRSFKPAAVRGSSREVYLVGLGKN